MTKLRFVRVASHGSNPAYLYNPRVRNRMKAVGRIILTFSSMCHQSSTHPPFHVSLKRELLVILAGLGNHLLNVQPKMTGDSENHQEKIIREDSPRAGRRRADDYLAKAVIIIRPRRPSMIENHHEQSPL